MRKLTWIAALLLIQTAVFSQHSVKGKVIDKQSKIVLSGANVKVLGPDDGQVKIIPSDVEGNFILNDFASGNYTLSISHVGYEDFEINLKLKKHLDLLIEMNTRTIGLGEVVVNATRANDKNSYNFYKC